MHIAVAHLSRRFAAQLIDALLVLLLALLCFHGTALSPLQLHGDRIEVRPFAVVPFASAMELAYSLPAHAHDGPHPRLSLVLEASGKADYPDKPPFSHTIQWTGGVRTTFTYRASGCWGVVLLWLVYATLCTGYCGQTLGKRVMGLRVVRKDGKPVGYGQSLVRALSYLPSAIPVLAALWLLLGFRGTWWHDRLAGTRVDPAIAWCSPTCPFTAPPPPVRQPGPPPP